MYIYRLFTVAAIVTDILFGCHLPRLCQIRCPDSVWTALHDSEYDRLGTFVRFMLHSTDVFEATRADKAGQERKLLGYVNISFYLYIDKLSSYISSMCIAREVSFATNSYTELQLRSSSVKGQSNDNKIFP